MGEGNEASCANDGGEVAISEGSFLHQGTILADARGLAALSKNFDHTLLGNLPHLLEALGLEADHHIHAQ